MTTQAPTFGEWIGFAKKLASRYFTSGVELADLEQEAMLAVFEGLPQYSEESGVSLKVYLGRRIQDRLRSTYRKTLNIVQLEQFWVVLHKSGDPEQHVRAESKAQAEAVLRSHPNDYVKVRHVKVHAPIGPSLDAEIDAENGSSLHEIVGEEPEQEWKLAAKRRAGEAVASHASKTDELATILTLRVQGFTFGQIGGQIGKSSEATKKMWQRAQKSSKQSAA